MRGPSTADCEKSYIRTGIPTANMLHRGLYRRLSLRRIRPHHNSAAPPATHRLLSNKRSNAAR